MLEKHQNCVVLSHIKGYCIWNRDGPQTNKTSEETISFPQFGVFSLCLGFFFRKEIRDSGLSFSFKKNAFWQALQLFRQNQHKTLTSLQTHTCPMTNHLTNELTRALSTQQKTGAD